MTNKSIQSAFIRYCLVFWNVPDARAPNNRMVKEATIQPMNGWECACLDNSFNHISLKLMRVLIGIGICVLCFIDVTAAEYILFKENGLYGVRDEKGVTVLPAHYEALGWSDGSFSVRQGITGYQVKGLWGIINMKNEPVTHAQFTHVVYAEGPYLIASRKQPNLRAGCIDVTGRQVLPFDYESIHLRDQRAIVSKRSEKHFVYGVCDLSNKVLIPVWYRNILRLGSLRFGTQNEEGRYALFSDEGIALTGFDFDELNPFESDVSVARQGLYYGLVDRMGQWTVQPKFKSIRRTDSGSFEAIRFPQWRILDGQNQELSSVEADSILMLGNNLFALAHNGEMRLANAQFLQVGSGSYSTISPFSENKALVSTAKGAGMISTNGVSLIDCKYQSLQVDGAFVLAEIRNNQWALLDTLGNQKTTKPYEHIERFNGVYFAVKSRGFFGSINQNGREIVPCVYDSILQYHQGRLVVKFRGLYGIIDLAENWLVAPQSDKPVIIASDRYLLSKGPLLYLKSFSGHIIYFTNNPLSWDEEVLTEKVSSGGIWTIDLDGRIIRRQLPPESYYEEILPESEGLRGIRKDGRYGFIDDQGRLRIANRYESTRPFRERLAPVRILGKWGFIDHDEKLVIQPVHDVTTDFLNGTAIVTQKKMQGVIDTRGKVIVPVRYDRVERLSTHRFMLWSNGVAGIADTDGRIICAPKYDMISDPGNGYFIVVRDKKYGLITTQGISTLPLHFDKLIHDPMNSRYLGMRQGQWETIR